MDLFNRLICFHVLHGKDIIVAYQLVLIFLHLYQSKFTCGLFVYCEKGLVLLIVKDCVFLLRSLVSFGKLESVNVIVDD